MAVWSAVLLTLVVLSSGVAREPRDYSGYKVLSIPVGSHGAKRLLDELLRNYGRHVDIWRDAPSLGESAHVMVTSQMVERVRTELRSRGLDHDLLIEDVQTMIDDQHRVDDPSYRAHVRTWHRHRHVNRPRPRREVDADVDVDADLVNNDLVGTYATVEKIDEWLESLDTFFGDVVTREVIGQTAEGRNLTVVKLSTGPSDRPKPAVWLDTGIHAREWVSVSSGIYAIYKLLDDFHQGNEDAKLLEDLDWYILPVANPDGYAFTHNNQSGDRMWRKNRVVHGDADNCTGVDLNRNWNYHWGEAGVRDWPCSIVYPGKEPNSELETKAMQAVLMDKGRRFEAFLSLHSYQQKFFTRWGYTLIKPENHEELYALAVKAAAAITDTHGAEYIAGRSPYLLYAYSGGSADWAHGVAEIKYCYTAELRDTGVYGFLLPVNYSLVTGEEIFSGIRQVALHVMNTTTVGEEETTTETMTTTRPSGRTPGVTGSSVRTVGSMPTAWVLIALLYVMVGDVYHRQQ